MTEVYSAQTTNGAAIQNAVMDICLNKQSTISFLLNGFDKLPKPEDLAASAGHPPPLPGCFVMPPQDVTPDSQERIPGLEPIKWAIEVYWIWPYFDDEAENDSIVKNATFVAKNLFIKEFDLEGTAEPTAKARGFKPRYGYQVEEIRKPEAPSWIALWFTVFAEEWLDVQYLPPL